MTVMTFLRYSFALVINITFLLHFGLSKCGLMYEQS